MPPIIPPKATSQIFRQVVLVAGKYLRGAFQVQQLAERNNLGKDVEIHMDDSGSCFLFLVT